MPNYEKKKFFEAIFVKSLSVQSKVPKCPEQSPEVSRAKSRSVQAQSPEVSKKSRACRVPNL